MMIILLLLELMVRCRIHERALRIVYDDYTYTFNELMVK